MNLKINEELEIVSLDQIIGSHDLILMDEPTLTPVSISETLYGVNNFLELGGYCNLIWNSLQRFHEVSKFVLQKEYVKVLKSVQEGLQTYSDVLDGNVRKFQKCRGLKDYQGGKGIKSKQNSKTIRRNRDLDVSKIQRSHNALTFLNNYFRKVQGFVNYTTPYQGNVIPVQKLSGRDFSDINYSFVESALGASLYDDKNVAIVTGHGNVTKILHNTFRLFNESGLFEGANEKIHLYFKTPNLDNSAFRKVEFALQQEDQPCNNKPNYRSCGNL